MPYRLPIKDTKLFLTCAFSVLLATSAVAETIFGRVVGITDGDTIKVLTEDHTLFRVRLAEIDAPEKGQPYGRQAKEALSLLCFGKEATLEVSGKDRYGRLLAGVNCDGELANEMLVRKGYAWVYRRYSSRQELLDMEAQARAMRIGIWSDSDVTPPWVWRKSARSSSMAPK